MKHTAKTLALLSLSLVLGACGQGNTPAASSGGNIATLPAADFANAAPGKWFVELEGDPTSLSAQSVGSQQASFRAQAAGLGIRFQEVRSYSTLFNGFSIVASSAEVNRISRMPGVLGVYPVERIERPVADVDLRATLTPEMFYANTMTGANIAQNELGLTGKGVKVAVMDTGIDVDHPAFAGRIVAGYDFVGDAYGAGGTYVPVPDDNPDDCGGHGSHVAGIVGGNDAGTGFKGVAPGVSFGAYKVFGCEGSTYNDIMLAAMERAYQDGMHVLNMSLGSAFNNWSEGVTAKAASRLVKKGMIVVASAGNSGATGQYSMGGPTMGENVISVASVDNVKIDLASFTITPDGSKIGFYAATGAPAAPKGLTLAITKAPTSTTTTSNDGCNLTGGANPYADGSLTGKAVLIRRGGCTFYEKAFNAQKAGASTVILYNNTAGYISPTVAGTPAITIPVVSVSADDGAKIDSLIGGGVTMNFDGGKVTIANPTANTLASSSSYGMSATLEAKPDIAAPGGSIYSAYPLSKEASGYAVLSGTSMASPHVAGAAALMLQAYPNTQAKDMRTLLMNTASLRWYRSATGTLFTGFADYVQRQGAGMVDIVAAHSNTVRATPAKLSLGESETFATRSKVVVLKNTGSERVVYTAKHKPALTIGGTTLAPSPNTAAATMTINGQNADTGVEVEVLPFSEVELNVVITPPAGAPDKSQYGGYIQLASVTSPSLVVPYSGFKGDYQSLVTFGNVSFDGGKTFANFPALFVPKTGAYYTEGQALTTPVVYDLKEGNEPTLLVNFAHQVRRLEMQVLDGSGNLVDTVASYNYVRRNTTNIYTNSSSDAFSFFEWDGKLSNGQDAPVGNYQLRLRALKPLGEESNPDHTEIYTSQTFTIIR